MSIRPEIPRGTRDFLPAEAAKRQYIFDTVRQVFIAYGYLPVETPAQELLSTLMGKYGEEGDRLIFKILNSGDYLKDAEDGLLAAKDSRKLLGAISNKALRYDLTVPFARLVVQHRNDLSFPFKRYQIQPVWRADRPQKGRYREFYQCDVDVIGSKSHHNEIEMVQIMAEVFRKLGMGHKIRINDRRILRRLAEITGMGGRPVQFSTILDKKDKVGVETVKEMLRNESCSDVKIEQLIRLLEQKGGFTENLDMINAAAGPEGSSAEAIQALRSIYKRCTALGVDNLVFDIALARGLDYYTGAIFEVSADGFPVSVCGGGRYDNLTGIFGLEDMSGVGVSFGADRIYDVMEKGGLFDDIKTSVQILFTNLGSKECAEAQQMAATLRQKGYRVSVYPDEVKMKKQMKYANQINAELVAIVGADELTAGTVTIKDMHSGEQKTVEKSEIGDFCDGRL